jgi:hypothetical protein
MERGEGEEMEKYREILDIGNEEQIGYPASELADVARTTNSYPEEISVQNFQHSNANNI